MSINQVIEEKTQWFTTANISKHADFVNNDFTEKTRTFLPNSLKGAGKKKISKFNYDRVNYGIHEFTYTSRMLYGNGEFLIDEGVYNLRFIEEQTIEEGKNIYNSPQRFLYTLGLCFSEIVLNE